MKISTMQAVARMILDHSSYFLQVSQQPQCKDLGQEQNMEPCPKSRNEEIISHQKSSVLIHSKIALDYWTIGLLDYFPGGFKAITCLTHFLLPHCTTAPQACRKCSQPLPFCEVPCNLIQRQPVKRYITMTHVRCSAPWGQSGEDVPELVSAARSAASAAHCQSCLINT